MQTFLTTALLVLVYSTRTLAPYAMSRMNEAMNRCFHEQSRRPLVACAGIRLGNGDKSHKTKPSSAGYILNGLCPLPGKNLEDIARYISCTDRQIDIIAYNGENSFLPKRKEYILYADTVWQGQLKALFSSLNLGDSYRMRESIVKMKSGELKKVKARMQIIIDAIIQEKEEYGTMELKRLLMDILYDNLLSKGNNPNWPVPIDQEALEVRRKYFKGQADQLLRSGIVTDDLVKHFSQENIVMDVLGSYRNPPGYKIPFQSTSIEDINSKIYRKVLDSLSKNTNNPSTLIENAYVNNNRYLLFTFAAEMVSEIYHYEGISDDEKFELLKKVDQWKSFSFAPNRKV